MTKQASCQALAQLELAVRRAAAINNSHEQNSHINRQDPDAGRLGDPLAVDQGHRTNCRPRRLAHADSHVLEKGNRMTRFYIVCEEYGRRFRNRAKRQHMWSIRTIPAGWNSARPVMILGPLETNPQVGAMMIAQWNNRLLQARKILDVFQAKCGHPADSLAELEKWITTPEAQAALALHRDPQSVLFRSFILDFLLTS